MKDETKEPLTRQEKIKRILLITLTSAVALVIIFGFIFGSPYSIKKNNYESFEAMITEHYDRPTVLMYGKKSCKWCGKVYPPLSSLKDDYKDRVNFYYADITGTEEGKMLKSKYPVQSNIGKDGTPTVIYFYARHDASEMLVKKDTVTGYGGTSNKNTAEDLGKRIKQLLDKPYGTAE